MIESKEYEARTRVIDYFLSNSIDYDKRILPKDHGGMMFM